MHVICHHGDAIEAMVAMKYEDHFNPQIEVQKCYKVKGHIYILANHNYKHILSGNMISLLNF